MAKQAGSTTDAFGPFAALFQNYAAVLEKFGQGLTPFSDLPGFDPQALTSRMTGPFKAAARCQLEVLGLVNRRSQAYLQFPVRLAQCRTPQDLINEQMSFWQTAMEQYADSGRKVTETWAQFAQSAGPVPAQHDYIHFNNGSGRDLNAPSASQDTEQRQRRVA
jgi:hypothetical protein